MPLKIEIVDKAKCIQAFLPDLETMIGEGLVTPEKVRMIAYRHNGDKGCGQAP